MTIWGYWNGPDDALAVVDEPVYTGIDALAAYREGRLTQRQYVRVMTATRKRLASEGIEDLSLRGNHLLLSIDRQQQLAVDGQSHPWHFIMYPLIGETVVPEPHIDGKHNG